MRIKSEEIEKIRQNPKKATVLVVHPKFGSLWLFDAEIEGNNVTGWDLVHDEDDWYLPPGGYWEKQWYTFPIRCIKKIDFMELKK